MGTVAKGKPRPAPCGVSGVVHRWSRRRNLVPLRIAPEFKKEYRRYRLGVREVASVAVSVHWTCR
jgi:hypothetical protein